MTVIDDVLARVAAAAHPVVVFDLDSTLISTSVRHLDALRRHGWQQGGEVRAVTAAAALQDIRWSPEEVLIQAGLSTEGLMDAWSPLFFSDHCRDDVPVGGAQRFVRQVHDAGALVVYLTARVRSQMGRGTATMLLDWGFPMQNGRCVLMLKPSSSTPDATYKHEAMSRLDQLGEVVATFENEPGHANAFLSRFPDALHVCMDTCHSPHAPALDGRVRVMTDFWPS